MRTKTMGWETLYQMEELLPIVAKLAEKYTGMESTSISYEKAQQLMGAVLYCIRECYGLEIEKEAWQETEVLTKKFSAEKAYELGYEKVVKKVKKSLKIYNLIMETFEAYGNVFLQETIEKGIPEFFRWYDVDFAPQDTILTLDYPLIVNLGEYQGIDAIYIYLQEIWKEQKYLRQFSYEEVVSCLEKYHPDYRELVENLTYMFQKYANCDKIMTTENNLL